MSNQKQKQEALAQNLAILANGLELGSQIVLEVAGGEDVGNSLNQQPITASVAQSMIVDEVRNSLRIHLGG